MHTDIRSNIYIGLVLSISCVFITLIALGVIYQRHIDDTKQSLVVAVQSQARLIEAVAQHDLDHYIEHGEKHPEEAFAVTLNQIKNAHESYAGFGETGEFALAKLQSDS